MFSRTKRDDEPTEEEEEEEEVGPATEIGFRG